VNVSAHHLKIQIIVPIDDDRLVPALKQMPEHFVPAIVTLRVRSLKPFYAGHEVPLRSVHQQMVMVGHEHISMNAPAGFLTRFGQGFEPALPILVVPEEVPPLIAPRHHVIDRAGILNTQRPGHAGNRKHK